MCESTAGDEPFVYKSEERECCLCKGCYDAVEAVCKKLIKKELKKLKPKPKIKEKPKVKKKLESK